MPHADSQAAMSHIGSLSLLSSYLTLGATPLLASSQNPFEYHGPQPGLFISDESTPGPGGGGSRSIFEPSPTGLISTATLLQQTQGLRTQLATPATDTGKLKSLLADYQVRLELFPQGYRDGVLEIVGGARLLRTWIDSSDSPRRDLALEQYPRMIELIAEKITRDCFNEKLPAEIDKESEWHSDQMSRTSEPKFLRMILGAMPYFGKLTLKVQPSSEFITFVDFNVSVIKSNFEALALAWPDKTVRADYSRSAKNLVNQLAYALLEILATSKDTHRLQRAHQTLQYLLPHLASDVALKMDAADTVMLQARQTTLQIATSTNSEKTYELSRSYTLILSALPLPAIRNLMNLHVATIKTVCNEYPQDNHQARIISTLILLVVLLELDHSSYHLIQLMNQLAVLCSLLPAIRPKSRDRKHLNDINRAWEQLFTTKLSTHQNDYVKEAAQHAALLLLKLRSTSSSS